MFQVSLRLFWVASATFKMSRRPQNRLILAKFQVLVRTFICSFTWIDRTPELFPIFPANHKQFNGVNLREIKLDPSFHLKSNFHLTIRCEAVSAQWQHTVTTLKCDFTSCNLNKNCNHFRCPKMSLIIPQNFQHILRVMNTNVDGKRNVMFALTAIKGIGRRYANLVLKKVKTHYNQHKSYSWSVK